MLSQLPPQTNLQKWKRTSEMGFSPPATVVLVERQPLAVAPVNLKRLTVYRVQYTVDLCDL